MAVTARPRGPVGPLSTRAGRVASIGAVAAVALVTTLSGAYWLHVFTVALVYVAACLSLVVVTGWSGQLNLHVASLGLGWGAYSAYALTAYGISPLIALTIGAVVTVPFAVGLGVVAVRFRGLELAVATLAMGLIFERLAFRNIAKALAPGGTSTHFESSFVPFERPTFLGVHFTGATSYFFLSLIFLALLFFIASNLSDSATGRTLRALRERELTAETLGVPVVRYRVTVFALSIMVAAVGGGLLASLQLGISPDAFNIDLSFRLLAATVIGGIHSLGGAVIGGLLAAVLPELVQSGPLSVFAGERLFLLFGVGMVLTLWRLPGGLVSAASVWRRSRSAAPTDGAPAPAILAARPYIEVPTSSVLSRDVRRDLKPSLLRVEGLRIRFGGVVALDGVSITVREGEITALIGPNGAGKSTLFNCISGSITPDDGRVYLGGADISETSAHRRAQLGISRTFQTVEVFRQMTVLENLMVGGHLDRTAGALREAFALPAARRSEAMLHARAERVAADVGLGAFIDRRAGDLPLGLLRVLEVGMALMRRPKLLLLDEPSAGLDDHETQELGEFVARARVEYGLSVLLVEHDMALVGRLAEHVYVLDFGTVISQGTVQAVREDPIVTQRYLGDLEDPEISPKKRRAPSKRKAVVHA